MYLFFPATWKLKQVKSLGLGKNLNHRQEKMNTLFCATYILQENHFKWEKYCVPMPARLSKTRSQTTVAHTTLNTARRHVVLNYFMLTDCLFNDNVMFILWFSRHFIIQDWTSSIYNAFSNGKKSAVVTSEKYAPNLDKHLSNLKDPPISKQIVTQADLDTHIMVVRKISNNLLIFYMFLFLELHYKGYPSSEWSIEGRICWIDERPHWEVSCRKANFFHWETSKRLFKLKN